MNHEKYVLMPEDIEIWYAIENTIKKIMKLYDFKEIRTPIIQSKLLYEKYMSFTNEYGKHSINNLLLNVENNEKLCLRPEGTLSILNTEIVSQALIKPQKVFYQGEMFMKNSSALPPFARGGNRTDAFMPSDTSIAPPIKVGGEEGGNHTDAFMPSDTSIAPPIKVEGVGGNSITQSSSSSQPPHSWGGQGGDEDRFYQYHQVGAEILGSSSVISDIETILLAKNILNSLDFVHLILEINSHGCTQCADSYHEALKDFLQYNYNNLCDDCKDATIVYPLSIYKCSHPDCQNISKMAPISIDYLCFECIESFKEIKKLLSNLGINYSINPNLLLNFDYYTRLVFQFITKSNDGKKGTVLIRGGRYDNLSNYITGEKLAAVGFSFNIDLSLNLVKENRLLQVIKNDFSVCIGAASKNMELMILQVKQELHKHGIVAVISDNHLEQKDINELLKQNKFDLFLIFREDQILEGKIMIISNEKGQDNIPLSDITEYVIRIKKRNAIGVFSD